MGLREDELVGCMERLADEACDGPPPMLVIGVDPTEAALEFLHAGVRTDRAGEVVVACREAEIR